MQHGGGTEFDRNPIELSEADALGCGRLWVGFSEAGEGLSFDAVDADRRDWKGRTKLGEGGGTL